MNHLTNAICDVENRFLILEAHKEEDHAIILEYDTRYFLLTKATLMHQLKPRY